MKKLIFPLLLILTIALTGCGSDSSAPKATDTKNSLPAAAPTEKIDTQQDSKQNNQTTTKKSKYQVRDLQNDKPHQFSK